MNKVISLFLLLSSSFAFAGPGSIKLETNLTIKNASKSSTAVVSYETRTGSATLTVPPGTIQGSPYQQSGGDVKNINYVLFGGKVIDQSSCGFVFDQLYSRVWINLYSSGSSSEGEDVTVSCSFS